MTTRWSQLFNHVKYRRRVESAGLTSWSSQQDRTKGGYNHLAIGLALTRLVRLGFVEAFEEHEEEEEEGRSFVSYRLTTEGADWLRSHQNSLPLGVSE